MAGAVRYEETSTPGMISQDSTNCYVILIAFVPGHPPSRCYGHRPCRSRCLCRVAWVESATQATSIHSPTDSATSVSLESILFSSRFLSRSALDQRCRLCFNRHIVSQVVAQGCCKVRTVGVVATGRSRGGVTPAFADARPRDLPVATTPTGVPFSYHLTTLQQPWVVVGPLYSVNIHSV